MPELIRALINLFLVILVVVVLYRWTVVAIVVHSMAGMPEQVLESSVYDMNAGDCACCLS